MNRFLRVAVMGLALSPAVALAADEPKDPLSLLEQKHSPEKAVLSPSTQAARDARLEKAIDRGLTFLDLWQSPNGSWDRLEGAIADQTVKDIADSATEHVGDTCLSGRALLDAVTSGRQPELSKNCLKAMEYMCKQVDVWNGDTIYLQARWLDPVHDKTPTASEVRFFDATVDTFWALDFLMEARERVEDAQVKKKVDRAVGILLRKIEKSQDRSGTWLDDTDPALGLHTRIEDPQRTVLSGAESISPLPPWMKEVEDYSRKQQNIVTHCMAMKVLNSAARRGLAVKLETLDRAALYFRKGFRGMAWDKRQDPGYEASIPRPGEQYKPKPILMTVWVSTLYDCDMTARQMLEQARRRADTGEKVGELRLLEIRAKEARAALQEAVGTLKESRVVGILGPAAVCLPDLVKAVRELAPQESQGLEGVLQDRLLALQALDGHFESGSPRADNTYGTATTLRSLMELAKENTAPSPSGKP